MSGIVDFEVDMDDVKECWGGKKPQIIDDYLNGRPSKEVGDILSGKHREEEKE